MKITDIKINGIREPMGFALPYTDVSFKVTETPSRRPDIIRIELADDYGKVLASREGAEINMTGERIDAPLAPRSAYHVRVAVTGDKGDSAVAESPFETGKMDEPWTAEWIAAPTGEDSHPLLRKAFTVRPGLRRARLYASAGGLFEACVNGEKLGDEYLLPGVTGYDARLQVITFPVNGLREGENEISFLLGKGWYMGQFGLDLKENHYGDRMALIAELHLDYADGSHEVVATDDSFVFTPSHIVDSGIYYGETVDRTRLTESGKRAETVTPGAAPGTKNLDKSHLRDRLSPPIRVKEVLPVQAVLTTPAGETVLDFGQNFAGFPEFDADLPTGTKITLDFGEILQQGNFYNKNYRDARSRFEYTSDGRRETVRPRFTFFGFRYVRVTGWPGELTKDRFRGCVLYSDMDRTGYLETGNEKINRLYLNTIWGLKSNFIDIPTDCPQRSERLGWTGDAQVFAPTACYHMDTKAFFHKYIQDLMDEQRFLDGAVPNYVPNMDHRPEAASVWADVGTILPMTVWNTFGSKDELAFAYPLMKGWVDYMDRADTQRRYTFEPGFQFGDWLGLDGASETSFKGGTDDSFVGAVYYYHSADLTEQAAEILGRTEDARKYGDLRGRIREFILREYFTPNGRFALDTQASYLMALKFGLWVDRDRLVAQLLERLKKDGYRIRCGFIGAPMLCTVLAENGLTELAFDFLCREGFPSWLYCVNLGATTVWERWNSVGPDGVISDTGMNSLNHYSYGSVMEFVYAYAAGLRCAEPGWRRAIIAPNPDRRLGSLDCRYDSAAGSYVSSWRINDDGSLDFHMEIPFGCEAEIRLPRSGRAPEICWAGSYDFHYMPERDYRKPFDEDTPLLSLKESRAAMEVLTRRVPILAGMAESGDAEFSSDGLAAFRGVFYPPVDQEQLEKAITEISNLLD